MAEADIRTRDFKKILLIKLSALGDIVHTLPLLNKLRHRYPVARIDWLVTGTFAEFLRDNPAINNVIEFPRDEWSAPWRAAPYVSAAKLIATLRAAEYDLVLDLQGQFAAPCCFHLRRAGAHRLRQAAGRPLENVARQIPDEARKHAWQGAREGSYLAYTHHIPLPTLDMHPVARYLGVASLLGLDDGAPDFSFPIPPDAATRIEGLLDYYDIAKQKLIAMAPGTNWDTKQWQASGFADVARLLRKIAPWL